MSMRPRVAIGSRIFSDLAEVILRLRVQRRVQILRDMQRIAEPMDVDTCLTTDDSVSQKNYGIIISNNETLIIPEVHYENHRRPLTTGIDISCKEERSKMEVRANRFGLEGNLKESTSEKNDMLYSSMGIAEENENTNDLRLNVLHMRGTEDMSTADVFKYFEDYAPASIEWINDVSCNVVWLDNVSAAKALLRLTKQIIGLSEKVAADKHLKSKASSFDDEKKLANDNYIIKVVGDDGSTDEGGDYKIDDNKVITLKEVKCPLPPGLWRKGIDYPKSKGIFLRFATRTDKKHPRAEKMSDYYKKYGNPNFGGIKGLLTESRKRMYKQMRPPKRRVNEELSDDEGKKKRRKNPWGVLSQTWGQNDAIEDDLFRPEAVTKEQRSGVKERLGLKSRVKKALIPSVSTVAGEHNSESSSESSDEEWCKRSKVLRMRMHADDEEEKMLKKQSKQLTQKMCTNMLSKSNDLRSRLDSTKKTKVYCEAIQVVLSNNPETYRLQRPHLRQVEDIEILEVEEELAELEEGEWMEKIEQAEEQTLKGEQDNDESEDSNVSGKEIQGPKGSVIKVVPRVKPRVASTVWARLNNTKSGAELIDRSTLKGNSRGTLKGDLRSRLGYHNRGRSPLRIEVKNDKYAEENSGTE